MIKIKDVKTWEAKFTVGTIRGYNGEHIHQHEIFAKIKEFQRKRKDEGKVICPVKISTSMIMFESYYEECRDISIIQYPRFPQEEFKLQAFITSLAKYLLIELEQNRITVILPNDTILYEQENAEVFKEE